MRKEEQAKNAFRELVDAYLTERDAQKVCGLLWREFCAVGAGAFGPIDSREVFVQKLKEELESQPKPYEVTWEHLTARTIGDQLVMIFALVTLRSISQGGRAIAHTARLTGCTVPDPDGRWLVAGIHASMPSRNAGEEGLLALCGAYGIRDRAFELLEKSVAGGVMSGYIEPGFPLYYISDEMVALLGYASAEEFSRANDGLIDNCMHPNDRAMVGRQVEQQMAEKGYYEVEYRIMRRDGTPLWFYDRGRQTVAEDGRPLIISVCIDVTDRYRMEEKLHLEQERFRLALEQIRNVVFDYDLATKRFSYEGDSGKLFGLPAVMEDFPQMFIRNGVVPQDCAAAFSDVFEKVRAGAPHAGCEIRMRMASDRFVWVDVSLACIYDSEGNPVRAVGVLEDITRQKDLEAAFLREEQYRAAILSDVDYTYEINLTQNSVESMAGEGVPQALRGNAGRELSFEQLAAMVAQKEISAEDRETYNGIFNRQKLIDNFTRGETEILFEHRRYRGESGSLFWALITGHLICDAASGDIKLFVYLRDIDRKKREELTLRDMSQKDSLTGLFNKRMTEVLIKKTIEDFPRSTAHAFLIVDIDNFKALNDNYGHLFGDQALRDIATKIRDIFRTGDVIGRIGGDEFVVFIRDIPSRRLAERKAGEICGLFRNAYTPELGFSCSVGVAYYPDSADTFEALYSRADEALYAAKREGRDRYAVYGARRHYTNEKGVVGGRCWDLPSLSDKEILLDEISDLFYISDLENYDMLYINRNGREVMGCGDDYHGRKCYELIQGRREPCRHCTNGLLRMDEYFIDEATNHWLGRHFLIKDKLVEWNGRPARMELAMDITEKENHNRQIAHRLEVDDTLVRCIHLLSATDDLQRTLPEMLGAVGAFYQADRVYLLEMDAAGTTGRHAYQWSKPGVEPLKREQELDLSGMVYLAQAVRTDSVVKLESIETLREDYPQDYAYLQSVGVHSIQGVHYQLRDGSRQPPTGILFVHNPGKDMGEVGLLESLAHFVASELSKRRATDRLREASFHDALTGLPNRNCYAEYINNLQIETLQSFGVMVADNNGLKQINERFGHKRGDEVICQMAQTLREQFGSGQVYRLSGDEFVVMCENINREIFLRKIREFEARMRQLSDQGVSVGYSWRSEEIDVPAMNHEADERMYLEKQRYYRSSSVANKRNRPEALDQLMERINNGNFVMYLQPKVDITTGRMVGAEALARYLDPEYGMIPPVRFIEPLEREKLIRHLDLHIFELVCRILDRWRREGRELLPISLNFSRLTILESDFMEAIVNIQDQYGVPSQLIEFEITETVGEIDRETVAEIGRQIKENGFRLSLDDFGTKYTSISMLSTVNLDVLKLDRSLVKNLETSEHSRIVVQSMIAMCDRMNIDTIAEGVETEEQRSLLEKYGCKLAQGYLYSKPLPVVLFEAKMALN